MTRIKTFVKHGFFYNDEHDVARLVELKPGEKIVSVSVTHDAFSRIPTALYTFTIEQEKRPFQSRIGKKRR